MKKPFLLIAGDNQYPEAGTNDWQECYATSQEAEAQVVKITTTHPILGNRTKYSVQGVEHDWYEIVDLSEWVNG